MSSVAAMLFLVADTLYHLSPLLAATGMELAGDVLLGLSRFALAGLVAYVLVARGDRGQMWYAWLAVGLFVVCGSMALFNASGLIPAMSESGTLELVGAVVGWAALVALIPLIPQVLTLKSPESLDREVAERKRAEQAARETEALFLSLIETLPLNIFRKDCAGRVQMLNTRYCETLGATRDELIGKTDYDLFPYELAVKYRRDDERVMSSGEVLETVEQHTRPDGTRLFVQVLKAPVFDAAGHCVGIQAMFWDVTERKQTEEALKASDARFRQLVHSNLIGVMTANLDGRVLDANDAFLKIVGYAREDIASGRLRWDRITTPEHRPLDELAIEQLLETGAAAPWEKEYIRQDGTRVPVLIGVTMLEGSKEECICFVLDITERKRTLEELREAKERADAASRAKSQFLANMSHEVRTPMNAIVGLTELVLGSPLNSQQREYLALVLESAESLLGVLNDVLDFSKVEVGKLDLERAPFDLRDSLGDAMKSLAIRARGKPLELVCEVAADVPDQLLGDALRLRQIVVNLVGNAIKFTDQGEVVLRVQRDDLGGAGDNVVDLHFTVRDTGAGIAPEKQETIFEPFEQADTTTTRRHGGTGLGLAICTKLVSLMGGTIWVESQLGEGCTFHFTARFVLAARAVSTGPVPPASLANAQALVVVENGASRQMLHAALTSWRMTVATAGTATTALELLRDAQRNGQPFQVLLVDVQLPDLDGLQLVERLRADVALGDTPVVLLTNGDRAGDAARCDDLSIAARLLKPVKYSALQQALVTALGQGDGASDSLDDSPTVGLPEIGQLRILLAEDSLVNQKVALGVLGEAGHEVVVVESGRQAVERATRDEFDLVLMDVQMPELDGLEATRAIRIAERGTGRHVPILAMTAHAMRGDRERCLAAGMDDYLTKPVRARRLHEKIANLLSSLGRLPVAGAARARDVSTVAAKSPLSAPPEPLRAPLLPGEGAALPADCPELDWRTALRAVGNKPRLLREVVEAFLVQTPQLLGSLRASLAKDDRAALQRHAHTIKGSLRFFGRTTAGDQAAGLERAAPTEADSELAARVESLDGEVRSVVGALEHYLQTTPAEARLKTTGVTR